MSAELDLRPHADPIAAEHLSVATEGAELSAQLALCAAPDERTRDEARVEWSLEFSAARDIPGRMELLMARHGRDGRPEEAAALARQRVHTNEVADAAIHNLQLSTLPEVEPTDGSWLVRAMAVGRRALRESIAPWMRFRRQRVAPHIGTIILFGAPGSGKGTIAPKLIDHFGGLPTFSTGDAFRDFATPEQRAVMKRGDMLSDTEVAGIMNMEVGGLDKDLLLVDGGLRSKGQVSVLDRFLGRAKKRSVILYLKSSNNAGLDSRMAGRGQTSGRADDIDAETRNNRLVVFERDSLPALPAAKQAGYDILEVDADQPEDVVFAEAKAMLLALDDLRRIKAQVAQTARAKVGLARASLLRAAAPVQSRQPEIKENRFVKWVRERFGPKPELQTNPI